MPWIKITLLMAVMTALLMATGMVVGGRSGLLIAFAIAAATNIYAYWNSGEMVLRHQNARPVSPQSEPDLYRMTDDLAQRADLPTPSVWVIESAQANAFATGRDPENGAVAVTTGLMRSLSREELAGVIAHELAHIKSRDTLLMTITATFAGAISMLANFAMFFGGRGGAIPRLLVMFLAPFAAAIVQMAISRQREYEADRLGAEICGEPAWLASALMKLEQSAANTRLEGAEARPAEAHMFIVSPLMGRRDSLFSTHPSVANRVEALRQLSESIRREPLRMHSSGRRPAPRQGSSWAGSDQDWSGGSAGNSPGRSRPPSAGIRKGSRRPGPWDQRG